jgi:thiamine biosynthesis lipoprotein
VSRVPGVQRVEHVMGMPIVVDVRDEGDLEPVVDRVFAWLREVDARFSTYKVASEISRLNRGELALAHAHPDVHAILERCDALREGTDGFFDARTIRGDLDPSGLVKGWSVDRAAEILDAAGIRNYAVNAGGDIRLNGRAVPDLTWTVGIQHPLIRDRVAAVVEGVALGIATSGAYARGDHVVDPHTGRPPSAVLSVTVVGRDLATADAYATAAFAMGERGPAWTARLNGYEAMTILADGRVLKTSGFPASEGVAACAA